MCIFSLSSFTQTADSGQPAYSWQGDAQHFWRPTWETANSTGRLAQKALGTHGLCEHPPAPPYSEEGRKTQSGSREAQEERGGQRSALLSPGSQLALQRQL